MTQEDLNEVLGKSLANYQLRQLAEDGGNLESALTLIDRLESELLNVQEHAQNLEFLLNQKDEKISQLEAKAEAYDRIMSGGQKTPKEIANIFGFPIAMDCYSSNHEFQHGSDWNWFTTKPFIDGENDCWTIERGQWGRVPYGLLNGYDGEWQESLTFPDRQIGGHR